MRQNLIIICILIFQFFNSQEYDNRLYSSNIEGLKYYKYENIKIYASIKDIKYVKNETPEQLVESIISCTNKEWEVLNTLGGEAFAEIKSPEEYNQIKQMDKIKNYLELINKIEFNIESVPTVIIKFYYVSDSFPKPQAGILVMQKYDNQWFKTDTKMVNNIALSVLRLKPEILDKILNLSFDSNELKALSSKILINNNLDFNALSVEIDSWYEKNSKMLEYFKDKNSIL